MHVGRVCFTQKCMRYLDRQHQLVEICNERGIATWFSVTIIQRFSLRGKNGLGIPKQPWKKQALQRVIAELWQDVIRMRLNLHLPQEDSPSLTPKQFGGS